MDLEARGIRDMAELLVESELDNKKNMSEERDGSAGTSSSVVRWERFLPKMVLRVLLVEGDDSTRQIIAALLRKCSYKVAAVSDGLKAWELLKGRPHNIDLILTEVDLPSISGCTLLTSIMEHEVCKNIPVIMMSSNDSVSTVYRCMLRGAADFLVKPIRKNELSNLWQHVWRRQASSSSAQGPLDESLAEETFETTAENNACNSSTDNKASIQRIQESAEKGSDSQGSCTKPELEIEGENTQDIPRSKQPNLIISLTNDVVLRKEELCHEATIRLTMSENDARGSAPGIDANTSTREEDMASYDNRGHVPITGQTSDDCPAPLTKQAIDLIGAFDNYLKCDYSSSAPTSACKVDPSPLLDLSLSRSHPCGSINQFTDEKHKLNHSDASAFRRYVTSAVESRQSISAKTCDQLKEYETDSDKQFFNRAISCNSDTRGPMTTSHNHVPSSYGEPVPAEIGLPSPQQRLLPLHIPVRGVRFEGLSSAYSSMIAPILCTPSGISTLQCPGSAIPQESSYQVDPLLWWNCESRNSRKLNTLTYQNNSDVTTHDGGKKEHTSECATDQSANISCFNGPINHLHIICESNENNSVRLVKTPAQCSNEESSLPRDRNCHRSQREAALTKFLLKRKDRCFEKKVRYESRKKLAEQRPRVKGQFVRQVPSEPPSGNT